MKLNVDLQNHSYPIYIERNAIQKVHEYIPVSRKIAIVTDTGVPEKWVNTVKEQCMHNTTRRDIQMLRPI